jgi:hypothetical protein
MTDATQMVEHLNAAMPNVKVGALRFWGEWFGKPYDNQHRLVLCEADGDLLRCQYDEGETLSVWSPKRLEANSQTFRISDAAKVRWEWFYYGRPKTPANRYFMEFSKTADSIGAKTNVDWYSPNLRPTMDFPAVEIP